MIKRAICLMLTVLLLFGVTGCGGSNKTNTVEGTESAPELITDAVEDTNVSADMEATEDEQMDYTNILVVYFSRTGTTEPLAQYAAEYLNADIFEIEAAVPYTDEDIAYYTDCRADREQNDKSARPEIAGTVSDMDQYDTIILGYPIWHGQAPRIIDTFLESYDFDGKTIVPFCTSHSSPIGSSDTYLHGLVSGNVNWKEGRRFEGGTSKDTMIEWLDALGIKPF